MAATRNPRAHTVARRWRIPPPLRGSVGFDGPEGLPVLEEVGGTLGSLVWGTLRTVSAWVDTAIEDRPGMFPEGAARRRIADILEADPKPSIESPLVDLTHLLDQPGDADPAAIGIACIRIARWAESEGYAQTAAQFFQVAANSRLGNPEYALAAAQGARDVADYSRAEVWLQRAIGLSRQSDQWEVYTKCFLALGTMMLRRGNLPAARRAVERAQRRAIRHGYQHLQAAASHDLLVIETTCGNLSRAEAHALEAMRLYPVADSRLRMLAHDVGCLWIKTGNPQGALTLFRAVLETTTVGFLPYVAGSMALAAGVAGLETDFWRAKSALDNLAPARGVSEGWCEVAEGALHLGYTDLAEIALCRAAEIAASRKEHRIEFTVEELRTRIEAVRREASRTNSTTPDTMDNPVVEAFVASLQGA